MKKITIILFFCFFSIVTIFAQSLNTQKEYFYYYEGEKIFLEESSSKILIKVSKDIDKAKLYGALKSEANYRISIPVEEIGEYFLLDVKENKSFSERLKSLEHCKNRTDLISANFMLRYNDGTLQGYSNEFVVKLLPSTSLSQLEELCKDYKINTLEQNQFDKEKYTLTISSTSFQNVFDLANLFYETGLFDYAEPNFVRYNILNTNDPFFGDQWSINNTGQYNGVSGVDMNVEEAWQITKGRPEIKIAVVDEGVDLNHPDLKHNLLAGFDATGNGSGGAPSGNEAHGTACAGIIAASADNNIGIAGIAPNCKIMPARMQFGNIATDSWLADCINWAWQNGADIISNSWGGGPPSTQITQAINHATSQGRAGLGCVVLCASGNKNDAVSFPAKLPNVIAVGAMSMCNERKRTTNIQFYINNFCPSSMPIADPGGVSCDEERCWGSNYGVELDVMAPGVRIATTDISGPEGYNNNSEFETYNNDYIKNFNGTSSACPNAAGVMGLILSVNRCLTWQEAKAILELSCDKTGFYCYTNSTYHPNGTWNNQMGYGRINAFKAVQYAHSMEVNSYSNISGIDDGPTNRFKWILISGGCSNIAAATYLVERHEVRRAVTFPYTEAPLILGTSNGFSQANPNNGNYDLEYYGLTETSATLRTFVYEEFNLLGQSIGWIPTSPANVRFNYTVLSALEKGSYFQNQTISTGTEVHNALNKIEAGKNVTTAVAVGDFVVNGNANITFHAGNVGILKEGTIIQPGPAGNFRLHVDPFFTCLQFPLGLVANDDSDFLPVTRTYEVENDIISSKNLELLLKNYPNPFSENTTIEFTIPEAAEVSLSVYNTTGSLIRNLMSNERKDPGMHSILLEGGDLNPGIYIYKLQVGSETLAGRMVLINH